jgi:hypothetical protein
VRRTKIVFTDGSQLIVHWEPERILQSLAHGFGQINLAPTADEKPKWLWVNRDNVLYIQDVSDQELPFGFVG